jgi:hypothetical protein
MTFANHALGGFAVGSAMAWAVYQWTGVDVWWMLAVLNMLIGAFPDVGSWVVWQLSKTDWWYNGGGRVWGRWELYSMCHPPYEPRVRHGVVDHVMRWWPAWGVHTWLTDSPVHPSSNAFVFPKFNPEWANVQWIGQYTKWDVLYVSLEAAITVFYVWVISMTVV